MEKPESPPRVEYINYMSNELVKALSEFHGRYISWNELKKADPYYPPETIWQALYTLRAATKRTVIIGETEFSFGLCMELCMLMHRIDMNHNSSLILHHHLDSHSKRALKVKFEMDEAIGSALLSGCMIKMENAEKLLRERGVPHTHSEGATVRTYDLIRFVQENSGKDITPALINEMNAIATGSRDAFRQSESSFRGQYKKDPPLTAVPQRSIQKSLQDLCTFLSDESIHPLVRATSATYIIQRVQPYVSGNGRTSRAVAHWCLWKYGYSIADYIAVSPVIRRNVQEYQNAFLTSEAEGDDMTYAIMYNIRTIGEAVNKTLEYLATRQTDEEELMATLSAGDLNSRQRAIVTDLSKSSSPMTIEEIAARYQVSYQTARADLLLAVSRGLAEKGPKEGHKDSFCIRKQTDATL